MKWRFFEIVSLVLIAVIMIAPMMLAAYAQDLVAYPLQTAVTMDGRYSSANEWKDATELQLGIGMMEGAAFFAAKYDAKNLYTIWDFVECTQQFNGNATQPSPNQVFIYLNPSNKMTSTVDNTMYIVFAFSGKQTPYVRRGTSDGKWTEESPASSSDLTARVQYATSPHSSVSHMIVELSIALTFGDIKSYMTNGIGAAIAFYDGKNGNFALSPSQWSDANPNTWGTFEFSLVVVPEFSSIVIPLVAALVIPLLMVHRNKEHRDC